jgi:hypothetical protein
MTIDKYTADVIFKSLQLRYAAPLTNPGIHSDYRYADVFSSELPISTKREFEIAEMIAKKYNLKLIFEDFSVGEGSRPNYEPVFVLTCHSLDDLKGASQRIDLALAELKLEIQKLRH